MGLETETRALCTTGKSILPSKHSWQLVPKSLAWLNQSISLARNSAKSSVMIFDFWMLNKLCHSSAHFWVRSLTAVLSMSVNHEHILKFPFSQITKISKTFISPPPPRIGEWGSLSSKASHVYRASSRTGKATQSNLEHSACNKNSTTDFLLTVQN